MFPSHSACLVKLLKCLALPLLGTACYSLCEYRILPKILSLLNHQASCFFCTLGVLRTLKWKPAGQMTGAALCVLQDSRAKRLSKGCMPLSYQLWKRPPAAVHLQHHHWTVRLASPHVSFMSHTCLLPRFVLI